MNRLLLLAIVMSIVILPTTTFASGGVPDWVKTAMGWYSDDRIGDTEFMETLQFLIDEGILNVPQQIIYRDIEIIKEVQAEPLADNHVELWKAIEFNRDEILLTVKFNPTDDLYSRFNDIENQIVEAKNASHDNTLRLQLERTMTPHTHFEYEQKIDQLWGMVSQLAERTLELEKKERERHDQEVRTGEVQS